MAEARELTAEQIRDQQTQVEIDIRLQEMWEAVLRDLGGDETVPMYVLGNAVRYAYGRGYYDGLADEEDTLGPAAGFKPQVPARAERE